MNYLDDIVEDLKVHEGFRAEPYHDTAGHLTIGYGTLIEDGITRNEAEAMLRAHLHDLLKAMPAICENAKVAWNDLPGHAQKALLRMGYNLGPNRLAGFKRMFAALAEGDFETAAAEALDSKWAKQVGGRRSQSIAAELRGAS